MSIPDATNAKDEFKGDLLASLKGPYRITSLTIQIYCSLIHTCISQERHHCHQYPTHWTHKLSLRPSTCCHHFEPRSTKINTMLLYACARLSMVSVTKEVNIHHYNVTKHCLWIARIKIHFFLLLECFVRMNDYDSSAIVPLNM